MFAKRKAIKTYLGELLSELKIRYGKGPYTPKQIRETAAEIRLDHKYIHYAYLIHCEQKQFEREVNLSVKEHDSMIRDIEYTASGGFLGAFIISAFGGNTQSVTETSEGDSGGE